MKCKYCTDCTDKQLKNADSDLTDNRQTGLLVREGTTQRNNSNRQTVTNIWS
jgi:hypothetical protein